MENLLELSNLSYQYNSGNKAQVIFKNLSYTFNKKTFYTILGKSGVGKTTLLSLASGLERQTNGVIRVNNQVLGDHLTLQQYRKKYCAIVFQSYNLIPYMTALQNVVTAMGIQNGSLSHKRENATRLLQEVGLTKQQIKSPVLKLSGGQQQRVTIARALSGDLPLVFADEPTGNLDQGIAEVIIKMFQDLAHKKNKCVIMVTHDRQIANTSDVSLELKQGMLRELK